MAEQLLPEPDEERGIPLVRGLHLPAPKRGASLRAAALDDLAEGKQLVVELVEQRIAHPLVYERRADVEPAGDLVKGAVERRELLQLMEVDYLTRLWHGWTPARRSCR